MQTKFLGTVEQIAHSPWTLPETHMTLAEADDIRFFWYVTVWRLVYRRFRDSASFLLSKK